MSDLLMTKMSFERSRIYMDHLRALLHLYGSEARPLPEGVRQSMDHLIDNLADELNTTETAFIDFAMQGHYPEIADADADTDSGYADHSGRPLESFLFEVNEAPQVLPETAEEDSDDWPDLRPPQILAGNNAEQSQYGLFEGEEAIESEDEGERLCGWDTLLKARA